MDRPTLLTVFNEWRTSSHVDAFGRLRRQRWSCRWHVVQHWETVRFRSSPPGLGTAYQTTSRQRQPTHHSVQRWRRRVFSRTFGHWQHASHWLCDVVLKRCSACTTLIWSYDDDDDETTKDNYTIFCTHQGQYIANTSIVSEFTHFISIWSGATWWIACHLITQQH